MVNAKVEKWISFSVKVGSIELTENDRKWSCYTVEMKDIGTGHDDGVHEIPFWAMDQFADVIDENEDDVNKKGWLVLEYMRQKVDDQSFANFRCE